MSQIDEDEEFDDIELDAVALAAIAGDMHHKSVCWWLSRPYQRSVSSVWSLLRRVLAFLEWD